MNDNNGFENMIIDDIDITIDPSFIKISSSSFKSSSSSSHRHLWNSKLVYLSLVADREYKKEDILSI